MRRGEAILAVGLGGGGVVAGGTGAEGGGALHQAPLGPRWVGAGPEALCPPGSEPTHWRGVEDAFFCWTNSTWLGGCSLGMDCWEWGEDQAVGPPSALQGAPPPGRSVAFLPLCGSGGAAQDSDWGRGQHPRAGAERCSRPGSGKEREVRTEALHLERGGGSPQPGWVK